MLVGGPPQGLRSVSTQENSLFADVSPSCTLDLHLHTCFSDGRYTPTEVLRRCADAKLDLVALTDHDLASPLPPGPHRIGDHELTVIAAAEISGTHEGREFHLLVYFPGETPAPFKAFCRAQCQARARRYNTAVRSLALEGVERPSESAVHGERAVTRFHLAQALVGLGHARSRGDAFARFLSTGHGHVPPLGLSFVDAIRIAREHGGITSWAHPPLQAIKAHVDTFAKAGLHGLEALRPMVNAKARKAYKKAAKRHGLFFTGGSDWHGWRSDTLGLFRIQARDVEPFLGALAAAS